MRLGIMLRHIQEKGGVVTYSHNLIKGFLRTGPENQYHLLYNDQGSKGIYRGFENVEEHVIPGRSRLWWDQSLVPKAANQLGLDLIFNPKLSVPLLGKQKKILVMRPEQFVHPEIFPWKDRRYFKLFVPRFCKAADRIIAPANISARHIVKYIGADAEKVVTVTEACGDHYFEPGPKAEVLGEIKEKYRLPDEYILFVGGLTPLKNFTRLVKAFARVYKKHHIPLVVVGFNRWSYEHSMEHAQNHDISREINFPGFVSEEDLPHIYRMAKVLFFPSIYEGFGIPICEAFATGCPVVTTKRGAPPEVAGDAAVLVDPYDVEDMASGLDSVLSDNEKEKQLIEKGRERAQLFRFDRCARETLDICKEAIEG